MRYWIVLALVAVACFTSSTVQAAGRNFAQPPSQQNIDDLHYIVDALADKSTVWIGLHVGALKMAGNRLEPVHTLRFLQIIFTDESMKVGIRNIRRRGGRYWNDFIGGIRRGFSEERAVGNLTPAMVDQFAQIVEIKPEWIQDPIAQGRWDDVVNILMEKVPRKGDVDRYSF